MIGHLKMMEKCHLNYLDEQNKRMESKLPSDARKIEKKLRPSKLERKIDLKFRGNKLQHQCNIKLVEELEKKVFLYLKARSVV